MKKSTISVIRRNTIIQNMKHGEIYAMVFRENQNQQQQENEWKYIIFTVEYRSTSMMSNQQDVFANIIYF